MHDCIFKYATQRFSLVTHLSKINCAKLIRSVVCEFKFYALILMLAWDLIETYLDLFWHILQVLYCNSEVFHYPGKYFHKKYFRSFKKKLLKGLTKSLLVILLSNSWKGLTEIFENFPCMVSAWIIKMYARPYCQSNLNLNFLCF